MKQSLCRATVIVLTVTSLVTGASYPLQGQEYLRTQPLNSRWLSRQTGIAVLGVGLVAAFLVDQPVRRGFNDPGDTGEPVIAVGNRLGNPRNALPVLGAFVGISLISGSPALRRTATDAFLASATAAGATVALKFAVGRSRPDNGADADRFHPFTSNASFPSGHTAIVAAAATSLASHTRSVPVRIGLYSTILVTGLARIRSDRHWLSDVIAGGTVGVLSARFIGQRRGRGLQPTIGPGGAGFSLSF